MASPQKVMIDGAYQPYKTTDNQPAKQCCCDAPEDCCLYPWPDPSGLVGGPFYPDTDLPDTVLLDGILMTKSGYQYLGSGFPPAPSGSTDRVIDSTSIEAWNIYDGLGNELQILGNCLIVDLGGTVVEDEFPSTYSGSFDLPVYGNISFEVERFAGNKCEWVYIDDTRQIYLRYSSSDYKWHYEVILNEDDFPGVGGTYTGVKDDPQNSPAGNYSDDGNVTNFVAV